MDENDAQEQPRKRTRRSVGREQKGTASTCDVKLTVLVPKHSNAKPDDKDAWVELGPNDPLPDGVIKTFVRAFAPIVSDFLNQAHLTREDFDDETWRQFYAALIGCKFGGREEDREKVVQLATGVLERKLERTKPQATQGKRNRR